MFATRDAMERAVLDADLVIGAVLVPGAAAPRLVSRETVSRMRPGSVMVDVAIDQGGCFETSRPTTHAEPTYVVDGVVHYCVTNMPGAVARTSAVALNNATLPFTLQLADKGWRRAAAENPHLAAGRERACRGGDASGGGGRAGAAAGLPAGLTCWRPRAKVTTWLLVAEETPWACAGRIGRKAWARGCARAA